MNRLPARLTASFVVVVGAVVSWLRHERKPFTELMPQGMNERGNGQCDSCGNRADSLEVERIGEVDYDLCRVCRRRLAA